MGTLAAFAGLIASIVAAMPSSAATTHHNDIGYVRHGRASRVNAWCPSINESDRDEPYERTL